jgi:hypothetical protein
MARTIQHSSLFDRNPPCLGGRMGISFLDDGGGFPNKKGAGFPAPLLLDTTTAW